MLWRKANSRFMTWEVNVMRRRCRVCGKYSRDFYCNEQCKNIEIQREKIWVENMKHEQQMAIEEYEYLKKKGEIY